MEHYDIFIVGGGAAGIAAAKACGSAKVLLADRGRALGGVLLQCTHRGFGEAQTGMEYAGELALDIPENVTLALNTTVLSVTRERTAVLAGEAGREEISFSQLILAAGCREIPLGALPVAGNRPDGIYTAGQMQAMMNLHGFRPEGPAVILGSGDLGLIMAEQLAREGIRVTLVERQDRCGGNVINRRCLRKYPIELLCGDTVRRIHGRKQLTGCTTERGRYIPCKSLLVAVGLRPERELIAHLGSPDWLHLCGNCATVHSMVESVVEEGTLAGKTAMKNLR